MVAMLGKTKLITLLLLLFSIKTASAQYSVLVNEPAGMFTFNQLWTMNIIYSGTEQGVHHYIEMTVTEEHAGTLFKIKTNIFKLYTGGIFISLGNIDILKPFAINILKPAPYSDLVYNGGLFPAGKYTITYNLYKLMQGGGALIETTSSYVSIESFGSVIQLNVIDNDTIDIYTPTFNWVCSNLQINDPRAIFNFKLVELNANQLPIEAIYFNIPYLNENINGSVTNLQYPNSARKLEKGKTYAWQVSVISDESIVAQSEVWTFTIRNTKDELPKPIWYFEAVNHRNASYSIIDNDLLHIKYVAKFRDSDNMLTYKIINSNNKVVLDSKTLPLTVAFGDNRYEISLCSYSKKIKSGLYTFEITDDAGQKWYVNFNYKTNNCN